MDNFFICGFQDESRNCKNNFYSGVCFCEGRFSVLLSNCRSNGKECVEFCRLEIEFVKKVLYKLPCNAEKVRNREEFASFLLLPYMVY